MNILVEISARHTHLDEYCLKKLFGEKYQLTVKKHLSQPGQFACNEKIDLVFDNGQINNVVVVGPTRKKTQVEISKTEACSIKLDVPIRESGNLKDSPGCTLVGPVGSVKIEEGVIISKRHAHLTPDFANQMGASDGQIANLKINSKQRSLVFSDVVIRISENFSPAVHIDTDEANAAQLETSCYAELTLEEEII